jgi:hypothetical protein
MTLPQIWNVLYEGDVPKPGRKSFNSLYEARAWRTEQLARIEMAKEKARFEEHKARRKITRGF